MRRQQRNLLLRLAPPQRDLSSQQPQARKHTRRGRGCKYWGRQNEECTLLGRTWSFHAAEIRLRLPASAPLPLAPTARMLSNPAWTDLHHGRPGGASSSRHTRICGPTGIPHPGRPPDAGFWIPPMRRGWLRPEAVVCLNPVFHAAPVQHRPRLFRRAHLNSWQLPNVWGACGNGSRRLQSGLRRRLLAPEAFPQPKPARPRREPIRAPAPRTGVSACPHGTSAHSPPPRPTLRSPSAPRPDTVVPLTPG